MSITIFFIQEFGLFVYQVQLFGCRKINSCKKDLFFVFNKFVIGNLPHTLALFFVIRTTFCDRQLNSCR